MNQRLFILFAFCFLCFALSADTWLQTYDPFDEAIFNVEDVVICSDGGYAINGTCVDQQTTIGWGFVIKTDSNGNMLWANKDMVDFQYENESRAFVETDEGCFISSSYYWGNGTALIKRDLNGNIENPILLEDIAINSMCLTDDGNIVLAGHNYVNYQIDDDWPCLIEINQDLEIIWSKYYEFENYEWGAIDAVVHSSDNGYLLAGHVQDEETEYAICVIKTDAEGDTLWTRILDVTDEDDLARTIIETDEGDIFIGGYLEGITAGFLWKLDSEGNTIWLESGTATCGYGYRSFTKSNDGSIISYFGDLELNHSLRKFDSNYNIEWTNSLPYSAGAGDKAIGIISTQYIVVASFYPSSRVALIKLKPDGTDINEEQIIISKTVLKTYPNPFNPTINFSFSLNKKSMIKVNLFNIKGQLVHVIHQDMLSCGDHIITWNAGNLSSGIYFAQLVAENKVLDTKKITLLK